MADRIELSELETYLYHSADILRTHVDASDYKMYVFPLLFFKRICDVYDEETEKKKAELGDAFFFYPEKTIHRFSIPEGCHWRDVRNSTENIGVAIVDAFRGIEDANGSVLQGVFGHAAWTNKNRLPDETLKNLIEHFSSKTLTLDKLAAVSASHCTLVIKAILTNLFTKTLYISNIELYLANF